ncbi:MAG: hypothetical protein ACK2UJ_12080 [Candidatus Promineifilaceae bacterium]|jgi:hypothetical protein
MNANSREGTLNLYPTEIQGKLERNEYGWSPDVKSGHTAKPGRSSATVWAAAVSAMQSVGYGFRQLLQFAAPAGESNFKRQIL